MTHTPTLTDHTFTCPACAWRAVLTTDGRIVLTQAGDAGHDHIGQARAQLVEHRAYTERILDNLRQHFVDCEINLGQLERLYDYVQTEGYGL